MSYGYKLGVGRGKSPATCTSWVTKALGPFTATSAKIFTAHAIGGQTAVAVSFGNNPRQTLYLLPECGTLKVNSLNAYHPSPPRPPHC